MKVFTMSMVLGLAVAGAALAQGSTLVSGYTKASLTSYTPAPKAAGATTAAKPVLKVAATKTAAKPQVYVYKAPMATRPLKTW